MAAFVRQKRQSRFYWAELGFMALGLLGLQPALFTSFLMGTPKSTNPADANYVSPQVQAVESWAASQLTNLLNNSLAGGPVNTGTGWMPQPVSGQVPSTNYTPSTYQTNNYAQPYYNQQPTATTAQQPYYASTQHPGTQYSGAQYSGTQHTQPQYAQGAYAQQNYAQQPYYAPTSPTAGTNTAWQNQAAYMAQAPVYNNQQGTWANNANTQPQAASHAYSNGGYAPTTPGGYAAPTTNYQYPTATSPNTFGATSAPQQYAPTGYAAQAYPYQPTAPNTYHAANPGPLQRYQPPSYQPSSSLFR